MQLDLGSQGGFVLLAIAVGLYSLTAGWLAKHSVSAAFSFLAIGALLGGAGIAVLGGRIPERALLSLLAEITLALVLFSAASTLRIREIEGDSKIVLRLIVIGLPLTIAAGTALVGVMVAVALMPPAVTIGLMLSTGNFPLAMGAVLLLAATGASAATFPLPRVRRSAGGQLQHDDYPGKPRSHRYPTDVHR